MRRVSAMLATSAVVLALLSAPATAQTDYFAKDKPEENVKFRQSRDRSSGQRLVIAGLLGGAALFTGVGLYFQLDAQSASDEISSQGEHTRLIYNASRKATYERWESSRMMAIGSYAIGAGFVVGTVVAVVLTFPGTEMIQFDNDGEVSPVTLAPVPGGAVIARTWSF